MVAAIELDDKSHSSKKAKARDSLLKDACGSANLPLIRFPVKTHYQSKFVSDKVESGISLILEDVSRNKSIKPEVPNRSAS